VAGQKVELSSSRSSAPVLSRPLKTGAQFLLVLPRHRIIYRHWDKERYQQGDQGTLIVEGEGLGAKALEFIVEREDETGTFVEVATLKAKPEGKKAQVTFQFPVDPPEGHLTKAEWKQLQARPGDAIGMHCEAQGYEGGWIGWIVERKNPETGDWEGYLRWDGKIEQGSADTVLQTLALPPAPVARALGEIVEARFQDGRPEGGTAWLVAKTTPELNGLTLEFVLERVDADGNWQEVGTTVATVKDGQAKPGIPVPAAGGLASGPGAVRFQEPLYASDEELVLYVDPVFLEEKKFEVRVERKVPGPAGWEEVEVVEGKAEGKA